MMASFFLIRLLIAVSAALLSAAGDVELLLQFKASLRSPEVLANWVDGADRCGFTGVECGPGGAVTGLDLSYRELFVGLDVVAASLLRVEGLRWLSLRSANVTGNLTGGGGGGGGCGRQLAVLDISGNAISGEVSGVFSLVGSCQTLKYLNLSGNRLLSPAAAAAAAETKLSLKSLDLSRNQISGDGILPAVLAGAGGCGELEFLSLAGNSISGAVPPSTFTGCDSMEHLDLSDNRLAGEVAAQLGGCGGLTFLSLAGNEFSGVIPAGPNLKQLNLSYNSFAGDLPGSLFRLADLETLDLSSNNVTGSIPANLCGGISSSRLKVLHLQNNRLSGGIPAAVGNCSGLVSLDLSFNYLTGTIPSTVGRLRQLRDLILWLNVLHGPIPGELADLRSLENLILDDNELSGGIPDGLRNCAGLYWLSLSGNKLGGRIPAWIGDLAHLAILKLGSNSFSGEIPPEIGECRSLVWLDLSSNRLAGPIPAALAKQSGKIAAGVVTSMNYAYLKNNGRSCRGAGDLFEFDGIRQQQTYRVPSVPACNSTIYYGLTKPSFVNNGSLLFLDLSYNRLEGGIPKQLGAMLSIFVLNLAHNRLTGPIPDELGGMRFCSILDLSYNALSGYIPGSVADLAMLSEIHLSNNNLTGPIPQAGKLITFSPDFFANNSGLCGLPLPPCGGGGSAADGGEGRRHPSRRRPTSLAGSVAIGLLFALLTILALLLLAAENKKRRRRRRRLQDGVAGGGGVGEAAMSVSLTSFAKPLRKLTFADLVEATSNFDEGSRIGSGGFGDVYKAKLKDGSVVAVKKLVQVTGQGDKEFTAEMDTIGKIRHRHLVPLLGYCKVGEERLLVYQYMKHGSLEDVLHGRGRSLPAPPPKLNWAARRRIAVGAARGLAFLHHSCAPHIIHRDMKSSNVLVDENLEARVSDFGMARVMGSDGDTHLSVSTLAGTPGYVPPEYYQSFRCSAKGDVYSFGVVLLELLTGRRPTDASEFGDHNNLVGWVKQHAKLRIRDVFDKALLKEDAGVEVELLQHLDVACACLDDRAWRRPSMIQVLAMFKDIQAGGDSGGSSFGVVEVVKISRVEEGCEAV